MDRLWSPWRYQYVSTASPASGSCIFCIKPEAREDEENLILFRGRLAYALLNLYPYTTGHLMVAPFVHVARLSDLGLEAAHEVMELTRRAEAILHEVYRPHGVNLGMNIGASAGAGVAGHIHMHVLPRWHGDANFMTTIGETRVMPELLPTTWRKLHDAFHG
jgi:ATP adenylyltransferase